MKELFCFKKDIDSWKNIYNKMLTDKNFGLKVDVDNLNTLISILRKSYVAFNENSLPLSLIESTNKNFLCMYNEDYFVYLTKNGTINAERFDKIYKYKKIDYIFFNDIIINCLDYIFYRYSNRTRRERNVRNFQY